MDYITVAEKLARLFCYSVIFTLVESRHSIKGQLEYCYEARIKEFNLTAIGVGSNSRKARQDSARRLTICLIADFQKQLLSALSPEKDPRPPSIEQTNSLVPKQLTQEEQEMDRMMDPEITSPQEFREYMDRTFPSTESFPPSP
jgi:hypothetical protein